jgi:hypothetical protein
MMGLQFLLVLTEAAEIRGFVENVVSCLAAAVGQLRAIVSQLPNSDYPAEHRVSYHLHSHKL